MKLMAEHTIYSARACKGLVETAPGAWGPVVAGAKGPAVFVSDDQGATWGEAVSPPDLWYTDENGASWKIHDGKFCSGETA